MGTYGLVPFPGMSQTTRDFIVYVREYTRDHPELNRLISGEESNDRQIAWAIMGAVSHYNGCPPITHRSLSDLLFNEQLDLMTRLTVCQLLEGVGMLQTRNHLNYANGGVSVGINDKTPQIMNWLNMFRSTADQMMQRVKVHDNIMQCFGQAGVFSEYWSLNTTYLSYV